MGAIKKQEGCRVGANFIEYGKSKEEVRTKAEACLGRLKKENPNKSYYIQNVGGDVFTGVALIIDEYRESVAEPDISLPLGCRIDTKFIAQSDADTCAEALTKKSGIPHYTRFFAELINGPDIRFKTVYRIAKANK